RCVIAPGHMHRANGSRSAVPIGTDLAVSSCPAVASPRASSLYPSATRKRSEVMFAHNKRLQYTVRVSETNPVLANLMLEQFGGPQGELAAAMRYFTQAIAEDDAGRKDMLFDIATEELSHLEVIGNLVCMLNKGLKGAIAEGLTEQGELFRRLNQGGDSHVT